MPYFFPHDLWGCEVNGFSAFSFIFLFVVSRALTMQKRLNSSVVCTQGWMSDQSGLASKIRFCILSSYSNSAKRKMLHMKLSNALDMSVKILFVTHLENFVFQDVTSEVQKVEGPLWKVHRCQSEFSSALI